MAKENYAGFWIRLGAYLLDGIIVGVPALIIIFALTVFYGFWGAVAGYGIAILISWLYHASFESSEKQATLGKQAINVKVVDYRGKRITFARASGRYFAKILSALILLIGFIMVGFTEKKQGLHDYIASTYVVENKRK